MKTNTKKPINTVSKSLVLAGVVAAIASPASAKQFSKSSYEYAQVVNVSPVVESYRVNNPIEQCWNEQVKTEPKGNYTRTPEIFGGLIGAAIGREFGNGRGQDVATVAGAVLGASVARDVKKNYQRNRSTSYQVVQRCELVDSYTTQERVVGYDVAYRYNGEVFHTQMAERPGSKIRLQITHTPA